MEKVTPPAPALPDPSAPGTRSRLGATPLLYTPHNVTPAYHLWYAWANWPPSGRLHSAPDDLRERLAGPREQDGLRLLEPIWLPE